MNRGGIQGDFVFVIVIHIIGAKPEEYGQLGAVKRKIQLIQLLCVYKHFQVFVLSQVHVQAFENGPCIAITQAANTHGKRLLVLQDIGECTDRLFPLDTKGYRIIKRCSGGVFFNTYSIDIERNRAETHIADNTAGHVNLRKRLFETAPLVAAQFEGSKTESGLFCKSFPQHTHKTHGTEILDTADLLALRVVERQFETVPDVVLSVALKNNRICNKIL